MDSTPLELELIDLSNKSSAVAEMCDRATRWGPSGDPAPQQPLLFSAHVYCGPQ